MTDAEIKQKIAELRDDNEALESLLPDDDVQEELDRNMEEIQQLKNKFENIRLSEEVDEDNFEKSNSVSDGYTDFTQFYSYKEGGETDYYKYSVIVERSNAYMFKKGLEKLGYGWDSYDEKERYGYIHFGLTQSQYNNIKKNSDILKLSEEVDEFGIGGFVVGLVAGGYVGYKIGVLQPQRETKDLLKTEKALYKELKKKKKGKKTDSKQEPEYTEYEDVTYKKNYSKGGKVMKTYDDFDRDYERFTHYVLDRIDLDERRKIREDWNRESRRDMLTKDEKQWENYLLKRVNEKSYAKGGMTGFNKFFEKFKRSDAYISKQAMLELYKQGIVAHIQIHDELNISVTDPEQANKIRDIMQNAVSLEVPNKVDYECGPNWGTIK